MRLVPLLMDAVPVPDAPGVNPWAFIEEAMRQGVNVALSPAWVKWLLADNARLVEAKNDAVSKLYEFNRE